MVSVEKTDIATFVDDMTVSSRLYETNTVKAILPSMSPDFMEVTTLFARPLRVFNSLLSVASTGVIATFSAQNFLSNAAFTSVLAKYVYYKCDVKFRVVINASPFAKGRLILATYPYPDPGVTGWNLPTTPSFAQASSCPFVEIDIGTGESSEISIPWSSQNYYEPIAAGVANWSNTFIQVLDPLSGTSTGETAEISVYMWLENLQFYLPAPQSGEEVVQTRTSANPITASKIIGVAGKASNLLSVFPVISPFAKSLGWILDASSKSLATFGYSRPISDLPRTTTALVAARGYNNMKGVDQSVVLGLDPFNSVDPDPRICGNSPDDMDIYRFLSRQQIVDSFNWPATAAADTVLYDVSPKAVMYTNSYISQFSQYFSFYKGSLIFRFSFVKNQYYSGRIAIRFFPALDIASATSPTVPVMYLDLRETSEIVIRIPYAASSPFLPQVENLGRLTIYVVNPLRTMDTLDQDINCFVSWCVGKDFGVAGPRQNPLIRAQSGEQPQIGELEARALDFYTKGSTSASSFLQSNGEMVTSLRSLIQTSAYALSVSTNQTLQLDTGWFGDISSKIPIEYFARYFRFYRGSRRYKFFVRQFPMTAAGVMPVSFVLNASLIPFNGTTPQAPTLIAVVNPNIDERHTHRINTNESSCLEVMVPYYSPHHRHVLSNNDVGDYVVNRFCIQFTSYYPSIYTVPPIIDVFYSAGEDFSFGYPAGCPTAS